MCTQFNCMGCGVWTKKKWIMLKHSMLRGKAHGMHSMNCFEFLRIKCNPKRLNSQKLSKKPHCLSPRIFIHSLRCHDILSFALTLFSTTDCIYCNGKNWHKINGIYAYRLKQSRKTHNCYIIFVWGTHSVLVRNWNSAVNGEWIQITF